MGSARKLSPPIKWHGGKTYLAPWILEHAPPRCKNPNNPAPDDPGYVLYGESHCGGLAVLLANDPDGIAEAVNDIDYEVTNFWSVLKSPTLFERLKRGLETTPCSEIEWMRSKRPAIRLAEHGEDVWAAVNFFTRVRQSMSGRQKSFTPLAKTRTRRGMAELPSAWLSAIDGLPAVHARLKRVVLYNLDALEFIRQNDSPRTWFYIDPPYLHSTRASTGEYAHEMTAWQHARLLVSLSKIKGRFSLSGYPSDLYALAESKYGWRHVDQLIDNKAAKGAEKREMTERLWMNYDESGKRY